jgi:hypothetical protein
MSNFVVGNLVSINPDLTPEGTKNDDLIGELGIPGLFRHLTFEIIEVRKDPKYGEIVLCTITNPEILKTVVPGVKEIKYEGEIILLVKDIVLANTKITLAYEIVTAKTKDEVIADLFQERSLLRERGKDKRHKEMRENWRQIQVLRGEIAGPFPDGFGQIVVKLPKQKMSFILEVKDMPGQDPESIKKFERLITSKIRAQRNVRKTQNVESKLVFGTSIVSKQGGVYLEAGSLLKAYEEMMKTTLETDKKPVDPRATYVGIEVEFVYSGKYDMLKQLLIEHKLHRHVCLKDDGSVQPCHNAKAYKGKELNLICKNTEVEDVLKRLDRVLADPRIDGFANRSCGVHVHLDARNRDAKIIYRNMVRIQKILRGSQPVGRVNNQYCKANITDDLMDSIHKEENRGQRYWVVNGLAYSQHKSIEIRIHEGTTNCESIYNWVSFLDAVANHKEELPVNDCVKAQDLVEKFNVEIPLHAIDYLDRRIDRFKSLSVAV